MEKKKYKIGIKVLDCFIGIAIGVIALYIAVQTDRYGLILIILGIIFLLSIIFKKWYIGIGVILPPIVTILLIYQACSGFSFA